MKDRLKQLLEELVEKHVKELEQDCLEVKRIVLFSSWKRADSMREALNYTENRLLTTQFKIDHSKIKAEVTLWYPRSIEGDYKIDVGEYLKTNFPEFS